MPYVLCAAWRRPSVGLIATILDFNLLGFLWLVTRRIPFLFIQTIYCLIDWFLCVDADRTWPVQYGLHRSTWNKKMFTYICGTEDDQRILTIEQPLLLIFWWRESQRKIASATCQNTPLCMHCYHKNCTAFIM